MKCAATMIFFAALMPLTATAQDWTGPYGGLVLGSTQFKNTGTFGGGGAGPQTDESAGAVGFFMGYQAQSGSVVYGGELGYSTATFAPDGVIHISDTIGKYFDATARIGFASGKALIFAKAGYSKAEFNFTGPGASFSADGIVVGVGVDYAMSEKLIAGFDYSVRDLSGTDTYLGTPVSIEENGGTLALRFGYRF